MEFDAHVLHLLLANLLAQNIHYERRKGLGKVSHLAGTEPADLANAGIDCSGYVQYVIYKSSTHRVRIPQGSSRQRSWCDDNGYEDIAADYTKYAPLRDDGLRIGFRNTISRPAVAATATSPAIPRKKTQVGHVWLVINGRTHESTKKLGNDGPASLAWSDRTGDADHFYLLGSVPSFAAQRRSSGYF